MEKIERITNNKEENLRNMDVPVEAKTPAKEKKYYLKNNARPRNITINIQRLTDYLDEDGNKWEVKVSCHRDKEEYYIGPEEAEDLKRFVVGEDEKLMIWYKNGRIGSKQIVPIGNTYEVENYPHILDFHCGTNKYDERIYNCYVGGLCEIARADDKEAMLKIYHFVDEVDEKGGVIRKNPYLSKNWNQKMVVDMNKIPRMEEVSPDLMPRQTQRKDRITQIEKQEPVKGEE
uniref:Uncharacterized protein n=1 Tax=viral metagenome TaxID=1070528 RepID=A0A6M3IRA5_9ZZZZ